MKARTCRRRSLAVLTATIATLHGCSSYQPSANEPTAKLRYLTHANANTALGLQDAKACPQRRMLTVAQLGGLLAAAPTSMGTMGQADPQARRYAETLIPAGRNLVSMSAMVPVATSFLHCNAALAFEAQPDAHYEVHYRFEGQRCGLQLWRLTAQGADVQRSLEPSARPITAAPGDNLCAAG